MIIIFLLSLIIWMYVKLISAKEEEFVKLPYITIGINLFMYIWLYSNYGMTLKFIQICFLFVILSLVTIVDIKYNVIPNKIIAIILIFGVLFNLINKTISIENMLAGFFIISAPLLFMSIILKGSMGGGDIKLMAVSGVFLGWKNIILAFIIASLLGSFISMILILLRKINKNDMIPYGPFLAMGIFVASLYGDRIISWYIGG